MLYEVITVMKPNFRSVYYFGNFADGNFLLRKKQHSQPQVRPVITSYSIHYTKLYEKLR